jgi:hypothetical protein
LSGNSIPVIPFAVTYGVSCVCMAVMGPILAAII